jgi:hypothetical protein
MLCVFDPQGAQPFHWCSTTLTWFGFFVAESDYILIPEYELCSGLATWL